MQLSVLGDGQERETCIPLSFPLAKIANSHITRSHEHSCINCRRFIYRGHHTQPGD